MRTSIGAPVRRQALRMNGFPAGFVRWTILTLLLLVFHNFPCYADAKASQPPPRRKRAWVTGLKNGASSAGAAACVKTLLQPIDAIKTVQQFHTSPLSVAAACRQLVERPGGIANFYAGLGVTVFGSMPSVALYFGVYSYCKQTFLQSNWGKEHSLASVALSAAIGNTVASFSRVPYEVVKQKLQAGIYESTFAALRDMTQKPGLAKELLFPKGGVWIQMLRDVPYAVVTLLLYESMQQHFRRKEQASRVGDFVVGGVSGGIGSFVTNPMDVVKTRIQTDSAMYGGSVVQCGMEVWKDGGAAAFLRGSVPRLMHKVPANAFFFLFYELFRRVLSVEERDTSATASKQKKWGR